MIRTGFKHLLCVLSVFLVIIPQMGKAWDGWQSDKSWHALESDVYYINSAEQLKGLADLINNEGASFEGKTVKLIADIDMSNQPWVPIGNNFNGNMFNGIFDGGGHSISNILIRVDSPEENVYTSREAFGLFGFTSNSTITNLTCNVAVIFSAQVYGNFPSYDIGGLVGSGTCNVSNVKCDVNISFDTNATAQRVICGGLFGNVVGNAERVLISGKITEYSFAWFGTLVLGSICGNLNGNITECASTAKIELWSHNSSLQLGGVAGSCSEIVNTLFNGELITHSDGTKTPTIPSGIAGSCNSMNCVLFAPTAASIEGMMMAYFNPLAPSGNIINSYYLSGYSYVGGSSGTPINLSQLQSGTPLSGFDTSVWDFKSGDYPRLRALKSIYKIAVELLDGRISYMVPEGESVNICVEGNDGQPIETLYIDGIDKTNELINGIYHFDTVQGNHVVTIKYGKEETDSTKPDINNDGVVDTQDVLTIYKYIQEH